MNLSRSMAALGLLAMVCGVLLFAAPARGQSVGGVDIYQQQLRVRLDEQVAATRRVDAEFGGWFTFAFYQYKDAVGGEERSLRQYQIRPWASISAFGVHEAYVRGLIGWDDWSYGDNPTGHGDEYDASVERAWYKLQLDQLVANATGQQPPWQFSTTVGRQYMTIGTALALSMPLDMIRFDAAIKDWEFMGFLGTTLRSAQANIDNSLPVYDHQSRCFWGVQATYTGISGHRPFAYFFSQNDQTDEYPDDPLQNYAYDSRYVGVGSTGNLILRDLQYQAEVVGEFGSTFSEGETTARTNIVAMAIDGRLDYYFRCATRPRIGFEYMFASGDDDRRLSSTATAGGNTEGEDHAFNAFGYRDTGLSFAPRLSNVHIYVLDGSFFPLEKVKCFKDFELGSSCFFYDKAVTGPISNPAASGDQWLGFEWDVYANWRLTSDVTWTIRYGAFLPGTAFENRDTRHFLLTAITFSF